MLLEEWTAALEVAEAFEAFNPGENYEVPPEIAELITDYREEALKKLGRATTETNDTPQEFKDFDALETQLTLGHEPLISLDDLLPAAFENRWATPSKRLEKIVTEDLQRIPGWLSLAPQQLGFLDANSIRCIAGPLLETHDAPLPVPAPHASWFEVLREIALEGPGHVAGRLALLGVLTDHDLLPVNSGILIPGWPHRQTPIRISSNPNDRPVPQGEAMRQHSQAVALTHEKKYEQARKIYTRLFKENPENFMIEFNLAGCEYHLPNQREQGIERIKKVHLEHPKYLQARGSLAGIYREQNELELANELLVWPDVDITVEITRFHGL